MFVGHGSLAFAIAAGVAHAMGWPRERALVVGLLAAAFGLAPDVDIAYALVGFVGADGVMDAAGGFWAASTQIHRTVTHSLVVGGVAALAAGWVTIQSHRLVALATLAGLVTVATLVSGALGGGIMLLFALTVVALAVAGQRVGISPRAVAAAAGVGLTSHPLGDLFTGEPPAFLYPFDVTLLAARPALTADPTLNLLVPLFAELGTFWLALGVYSWVTGDGIRPTVRRNLRFRAALGLGFAGFALVARAPTLDTSYHFVFPLVGFGVAAGTPLPAAEATSLADLREQPLAAAITGVTAVTLAAVAYTTAYLLV